MRSPLLLLIALALAGCGDTFVDPFLRDAGAISVYGVLEAGFDNEPPREQTVRVQSVRTNSEPPRSPDDPALNYTASVVTVDTFTGDSLRWDGRRVRFPDGTYGDLFSATFRPRPGGTYDLVVRRDDDRVATARLTIPLAPEGEALPWQTRGDRVVEDVAWETVGLGAASALVNLSCGFACGLDVRLEELAIRDLGDGRFAAEVDLTEAYRLAQEILDPPGNTSPVPDLTIDRVRVTARLLGPEWTRSQDPTQTSLTGGYGFVGGAALVDLAYRPSDEAARAAGFVTL